MKQRFPYELSRHAKGTIRERRIKLKWIKSVLENPTRTVVDPEDPVLQHALAVVEEFGGRVLRVVYNPSVRPWRIVTVFFDRRERKRHR